MLTIGFIEIAPTPKEKVCYNCKCFHLWGVHTGVCSLKWKDKLDVETCKKFEAK